MAHKTTVFERIAKAEIEKELKRGVFLFAVIPELDASKFFPVRDVRTKQGEIQVEVLEGWFKPSKILTANEVKNG